MIWSTRSILSPSRADAGLARLLGAIALAVALLFVLVVAFLTMESWPILEGDGGWRLFLDDGWFPASGQFNLLPMLWATLAASIGAMLIAVPLGLLDAIFSRFYAPTWLQGPLRQVNALLAGIPSVVYGFWGLTVLVPLIASWEPPGASLLAGILILALMVLPTVALTSEAALATVPTSFLLGAAALGLDRKAVVLRVALPAARRGILVGAMLAAARALGETMALLMVAGNVVQTPGSLFDPVRVLTANIALEMAYATGDHRAGLFASGLLLMSVVTLLTWLATQGGARAHATA